MIGNKMKKDFEMTTKSKTKPSKMKFLDEDRLFERKAQKMQFKRRPKHKSREAFEG
jgi:hypothetical protein